MVRPAARVGQWHHSRMTAGLSPFDSKRSKIQCTSRSGCNADTPRVGGDAAECAQSPLPASYPSLPWRESGERVRGGAQRQGMGPALRPGLQVLPLVFCLNEAAGLNVARNLHPSAKACQSPFPRLFKNERAHPPFPLRTVRYGTSQGPVKRRGAGPACSPCRGMQRHLCSFQNMPGGPCHPNLEVYLSENTINSSSILLPTAPCGSRAP